MFEPENKKKCMECAECVQSFWKIVFPGPRDKPSAIWKLLFYPKDSAEVLSRNEAMCSRMDQVKFVEDSL